MPSLESPKCVVCGAKTELFSNGTPICVACCNKRKRERSENARESPRHGHFNDSKSDDPTRDDQENDRHNGHS
jgi:hypothetical protein